MNRRSLVLGFAASFYLTTVFTARSQQSLEIPLPEITSKFPRQNITRYEFPPPIGELDLVFERSASDGRIQHARIQFGQYAALQLPDHILSCLPDPMVEMTAFLYIEVDATEPKWPETWWTSVSFPFGRLGENLRAGSIDPGVDIHFYPQIEFEILGQKVQRVLIRKSPDGSHAVALSDKMCPEQDIDWAIGK